MLSHTLTVGNVEISSFSDGVIDWDLCNFYPSVPSDSWKPYEYALTADHGVRFNMASSLVRSDGRTILVDTGLGPEPALGREGRGQLLNELGAHGIRLDDIDMVVMTHLHRDHVGWNLLAEDGKYAPTFPRARYWVGAKDLEYFRRPEVLEEHPTTHGSVLPLLELGLLETMDGEHPLTSELTTLPTPGHTPGHMSILIVSQGEKGLILGDVAHNPAQVHETDWCSRADIDPEQTRATRRTLMEELESEGTLIAAGHFPAPGFGRLARLEGRRFWQAL